MADLAAVAVVAGNAINYNCNGAKSNDYTKFFWVNCTCFERI